MTLEDRAREIAQEYAQEFTSVTSGGTTLTVPRGKMLFFQDALSAMRDFARQVVREERERCRKATCIYCRDGIALNPDDDFHVNGMKCRAAAIRSLEDEP